MAEITAITVKSQMKQKLLSVLRMAFWAKTKEVEAELSALNLSSNLNNQLREYILTCLNVVADRH